MTVTIKKELVTPELAAKWLNANTDNRSLRDGVVERYANDMKTLRWTQCPAPICFYEDGGLGDGQHRLYAVIESEMAQEFFVARGFNRADGLNFDVGLGRTLVDNGRISGLDTGLSHNLIACARAVQSGEASRRGGGSSNAEKLEIVAEHREACNWAISHLPPSKNIYNSAILGAVARAWYWEADKERLDKFCKAISSGFSDGDADSAAIAMRNYMIQHAGIAAGSSMWRDTFMKAMNAIEYFMKRKKLTYIKGVKEEAYPLKKKRSLKKAA